MNHINGKLYLYGGEQVEGGIVGEMFTYDLSSGDWATAQQGGQTFDTGILSSQDGLSRFKVTSVQVRAVVCWLVCWLVAVQNLVSLHVLFVRLSVR